MNWLPRLYPIADASFGDPVFLAQALFDGGARLIQVRNKAAGVRELLDQVQRIQEIMAATPGDARAAARVIVNDRADVARIAGAGGVHLGQHDLPVAAARLILGRHCVVGFSTHNLHQALEADTMDTDYIAVGPIFPTSTKANPDPVVGLDILGTICQAVRKPVVAIGGITFDDAERVFAAGASSVAIVSDLLKAPDIAARMREWNARLGT